MVADVLVQGKTLDKLAKFNNERAASAPSAFALNHLKKLGWSEGDGLGKDRQGMSTHVKVTKKDDTLGIGATARTEGEFKNTWWASGLDDALSKFNVPNIGGDSEDDSDSSDDDSDIGELEKISMQRDLSTYTEEDRKLFIACGGRRCGKRAGTLQKGKILRELHADTKFKDAFVQLTKEKGDDAHKEFHKVAKKTAILSDKKEKKKKTKKNSSSKKKKSKKRKREDKVATKTKKKKT
uniref:G-patch domain-containing protein n=1 Tax=Mucochytrium quahogii TaxID=96639 RepID=A0A7S2W480_9STRA|mmetsp:Transcript_15049/g.26406  ORF Transcript_15049/g.26406 Transcript_15049/m.26406 type:complete len:238 (-) Transcript_15049:1277-1990(-)